MARKKVVSAVDPKRARQLRAKERREARKGNTIKDKAPNSLEWLTDISLKVAAMKVLNQKDHPYWLSIPHGKKDGNIPLSGYLPCKSFRTDTRVYYGFLFREHRDATFAKFANARKELASNVAGYTNLS